MNKNNVVIVCPLHRLAAEFEIKPRKNNISGLSIIFEGQNRVRNAFTVTFSRELDANTLTFFTGQQIYDFHVRADGADGVARALCGVSSGQCRHWRSRCPPVRSLMVEESEQKE